MNKLKICGLLLGLLLLNVSLARMQSGALLAPEGVEGETYYAPFPVNIQLDGEFNDWFGVPQVYMGQGVGRPAMSFAAAADSEYLYLYADVIDSNIISGEHGNDYWNEDSVEFYLNGTGDLTLRSYTDGVAQLTFPPLNRNLPPEEAIIAGVRGASLNARVVTVETATGWALEAAVPLKGDVWQIEPQQGGVLGFQVHLNAASELNRNTKLIWGSKDTSDQSYQNPSLFSELIFHEVSAPTVTAGEYLFTSSLAEDGRIDNFENGIWLGQDREGQALGLAPLTEQTALAIHQITPTSVLALPEQSAGANNVLGVSSTEDGQFIHAFTDGLQQVPQDWSAYNALGMWIYATDSVQIDLYTASETGSYILPSNEAGWQYIIVPFPLFESATPLDFASVRAYGLTFSNAQTVYIDDVKLFIAENTANLIRAEVAPQISFILDEEINWDSREWTLLWSDEFEGEAGTPIDSTSWTCEVGGEGWGNNEMQYYTTRTDNVALDGAGNLAIVARADRPENSTCWYGSCAFSSARCITRDKVEFTYGRVEARLQIPEGQGIWPAFWMLGANFPEVGWPDSGEIDIMENIGREPQIIHGTIHGPGYSGASGIGGSYYGEENFADDFHVYAIDWSPNVIRWYVDGELYSTLSVNDLRNREWVFNHDFFMILNVAVGGNWPGFPNETTVLPQTMLVDYVRVYQLEE